MLLGKDNYDYNYPQDSLYTCADVITRPAAPNKKERNNNSAASYLSENSSPC